MNVGPKQWKRHYMKIARQLNYGSEVQKKLRNATDENEAIRIMITARKENADKDDNS